LLYSKVFASQAEVILNLHIYKKKADASIQDYEILLRRMQGDEEVIEALLEAHSRLKVTSRGSSQGLEK